MRLFATFVNFFQLFPTSSNFLQLFPTFVTFCNFSQPCPTFPNFFQIVQLCSTVFNYFQFFFSKKCKPFTMLLSLKVLSDWAVLDADTAKKSSEIGIYVPISEHFFRNRMNFCPYPHEKRPCVKGP